MPSLANRWSGCSHPLAGLLTNPLRLSIFDGVAAVADDCGIGWFSCCADDDSCRSVPCPDEVWAEEVTIVADINSLNTLPLFIFYF